MKNSDDARTPVIVGVGQINDRPKEDAAGMDTLALMKAALEISDHDAGGGFLARLQSLDVVDQMSWPTMTWPSLEKIAPRLVETLGIAPAHLAMTADPSGDGPVRLLNEVANRIANGEAEIAAVVGGEALRTGAKRAAAEAQKSAAASQAPKKDLLRDVAEQHFKPILRKYGLLAATDIYPLYENACRAAWGQSLAQAQRESALIWSGMSATAADNPDAWIRTRYTPDQILTPSAENRPVTFPYNKLMVANNSVNQGAAVIVTSLARATAAGIPEKRLVYIGAGAAAHEPDDFLSRDGYDHSAGMVVSLTEALAANGLRATDLDYVELYSCFPCVPKMARRVLEWPLERAHSIYGGLTFGGAPIGNCMTHAAATLVKRLRDGGTHGLLYGNGGFVTHNHSLVLTRERALTAQLPRSYDYQREADARRGAIPPLVEDYSGPGTIETYVVPFDRNGEPRFGTIIARSPAGERFLCRVPREDKEAVAFLISGALEPVGTRGTAVPGPDGYIYWMR
jgi:acetyl-CoA C-acetyltransferase